MALKGLELAPLPYAALQAALYPLLFFFLTLLHLPPGEQLLPPPQPPLPLQQFTQGATLDAAECVSHCVKCNVQDVMASFTVLTITYRLIATF